MECICAVVRSVEIDASDLHPGGRYRLCIDMDGSGVPVGALGQNWTEVARRCPLTHLHSIQNWKTNRAKRKQRGVQESRTDYKEQSTWDKCFSHQCRIAGGRGHKTLDWFWLLSLCHQTTWCSIVWRPAPLLAASYLKDQIMIAFASEGFRLVGICATRPFKSSQHRTQPGALWRHKQKIMDQTRSRYFSNVPRLAGGCEWRLASGIRAKTGAAPAGHGCNGSTSIGPI